jgi:hypothetical protein
VVALFWDSWKYVRYGSGAANASFDKTDMIIN